MANRPFRQQQAVGYSPAFPHFKAIQRQGRKRSEAVTVLKGQVASIFSLIAVREAERQAGGVNLMERQLELEGDSPLLREGGPYRLVSEVISPATTLQTFLQDVVINGSTTSESLAPQTRLKQSLLGFILATSRLRALEAVISRIA